MNKEFKYNSNEFEKQAQRFIIPLYLKDRLDNYQYSSTGTYVEYNGKFYLICAAHAISDKESVEDLYWLSPTGEMVGILSQSFYHKIFKEDDIIIVDYFNERYVDRNYFNLNHTISYAELNNYFLDRFYWIGFPNGWSKLKKISKTKSAGTLQETFFHVDENGRYAKNAKYYMMGALGAKPNSNDEVKGKTQTKNVPLKYKGTISNGPSPKGMSGGAFFTTVLTTTAHHEFESVEKSFIFLGIGVECSKDDIVKGVSKKRLIEILNEYLFEHPLDFKIVDSNE